VYESLKVPEALELHKISAKFPKVIMHDKRTSDIDEDQLRYFFDFYLRIKREITSTTNSVAILNRYCSRPRCPQKYPPIS
jgi:hypothetical protein